MDRFVSDKIMNILNQDYHFRVFKVIGSYMEFDKSYMAFIYWETNKELDTITDDAKKMIKSIIFDYFKNNGYFPDEVQDIILYFNSDENVQKNIKATIFMQHAKKQVV